MRSQSQRLVQHRSYNRNYKRYLINNNNNNNNNYYYYYYYCYFIIIIIIIITAKTITDLI